jgi:hypothetical protein
MRRLAWFVLVLTPVLLASAACGSDDGGGGSSSGGTSGSGGSATGGSGGSATGGSAGMTGGTAGAATGGTAGAATGGTGGSGGSPPDIGTCTSADGNPGTIGGTDCHQLPHCAAEVEFQTGTGTKPTPAGGTFQDGLYALTAVRVYGQTAPAGVKVKVTMYKQGDTVYEAATSSGKEGRTTGTVSMSGVDLTLTQTCPGTGVQQRQYTATSDTLLDFNDTGTATVVYEYTLVK